MKATTLLLFMSLFFAHSISAQIKAIKMTNQKTGKEVMIKHNKRVRLKTTEGKKLSGKIQIQENNSVVVMGRQIPLSDIAEIKRNPLATSILTGTGLIYVGGLTVGIAAIAGVFADSSAFLLIAPGAALIYIGAKSPNFHKKYKNDGTWTYEIVSISQ